MCKRPQGRLCVSQDGRAVYCILDCRNWKCPDCAAKMRAHYRENFDDIMTLRESVYYGEVDVKFWENSAHRTLWKRKGDFIKIKLGDKVVFFCDRQVPGASEISVKEAQARWRAILSQVTGKCITCSKGWRISGDDYWNRGSGKFKAVARMTKKLFDKVMEVTELGSTSLYSGAVNVIRCARTQIELLTETFLEAIKLYASGQSLHCLKTKFRGNSDADFVELREEVSESQRVTSRTTSVDFGAEDDEFLWGEARFSSMSFH